MDATKLRLPISIVIAALGAAAGTGGTLAASSARLAQTETSVTKNETRIGALEREAQANRERVLRIELLSEQTKAVVDRIDKKIDGR